MATASLERTKTVLPPDMQEAPLRQAQLLDYPFYFSISVNRNNVILSFREAKLFTSYVAYQAAQLNVIS